MFFLDRRSDILFNVVDNGIEEMQAAAAAEAAKSGRMASGTLVPQTGQGTARNTADDDCISSQLIDATIRS